MLFFLEEEKVKSAVFSGDEREILIDFYKNNPPLWNHRMEVYRNRDLRQALLNKLMHGGIKRTGERTLHP